MYMCMYIARKSGRSFGSCNQDHQNSPILVLHKISGCIEILCLAQHLYNLPHSLLPLSLPCQIKKDGIGTVYCYPPTQVSVIDAATMGEALDTFTVCASPIHCIATVPGFNENDPDVLTSELDPINYYLCTYVHVSI